MADSADNGVVNHKGELFKSNNGDIVDASLSPLGLEIVVDLTTAHDQSSDLAVIHKVVRGLIKDLLESESLSEFCHSGHGWSVLHELLGLGNNQRLSERSSDLSSEEMEVTSSG